MNSSSASQLRSYIVIVLALGGVGACGGSEGSGSSSSGATSSGASGSSGATSSGGGTSSRFIGTWDLVVTKRGSQQATGTLTVAPASFEVSWDRQSVAVDLAGPIPKISGQLGKESGDLTATHKSEPLSVGEIPFGIGGLWNFQGRVGDRCTAQVDPGNVTLTCSNLGRPLQLTLQDYDNVGKKPLGSGTSTMQRTREASSIFGELGGDWKVVAPRNKCDVKIEGERVVAVCTDDGQEATLEMTFGDGLASGSATGGLEVSAKRR